MTFGKFADYILAMETMTSLLRKNVNRQSSTFYEDLYFLRIFMHRYSLKHIIENRCLSLALVMKTFVEMMSFYLHIDVRSMSSSFLLVLK